MTHQTWDNKGSHFSYISPFKAVDVDAEGTFRLKVRHSPPTSPHVPFYPANHCPHHRASLCGVQSIAAHVTAHPSALHGVRTCDRCRNLVKFDWGCVCSPPAAEPHDLFTRSSVQFTVHGRFHPFLYRVANASNRVPSNLTKLTTFLCLPPCLSLYKWWPANENLKGDMLKLWDTVNVSQGLLMEAKFTMPATDNASTWPGFLINTDSTGSGAVFIGMDDGGVAQVGSWNRKFLLPPPAPPPAPPATPRTAPPPPVGTIGNGTCGATAYGLDCNTAPRGSFAGMKTFDQCMTKLKTCGMAYFGTFSLAANDCSWYAECDWRNLCADCTKPGPNCPNPAKGGCPSYYYFEAEVLKSGRAPPPPPPPAPPAPSPFHAFSKWGRDLTYTPGQVVTARLLYRRSMLEMYNDFDINFDNSIISRELLSSMPPTHRVMCSSLS